MDIVRRSVKYARIEIQPEGTIKVVAPKGFDVDELIRRKQNWIDDKLSRIGSMADEIRGKENMLLLNGSFYELSPGEVLDIDNGRNIVTTPGLTKLREWLGKRLREEVHHKSRHHGGLMGVEYGRIFIRRQKTKWASCSGKGNLSFNMAMMALPETLREYLVIHELAHRLERSHREKFWTTVERQYPNTKNARAELNRYSLMLAVNGIWKSLMEGESK